MNDSTPNFPDNITEYAPWVAKHGLRYPYGLCQCGCGQRVNIARSTDLRFGYYKGQPYRFINNHQTRVQPAQAPWVTMYGLLQPYGKCQCGCGQDAPIAKCIRKTIGIKQGQPTRFVPGHIRHLQPDPPRQPIENFWDYTIRDGPDDCWRWNGSVDSAGYALFSVRGLGNRACRISYILHYGPIPKGMLVCHHCDNPECTRPDHLFLGTPKDNVDDMVAKGRQAYGERHWKSKLTESDIIEIRELRVQGMTQIAISRRYGVSQANISRILLGKNWSHVP